MKKLICLLGITWHMVGFSQPNPLYFSTGLNNALSGFLPYPSSEIRWKVAIGNINGPYVTPVRSDYGWTGNTNQGAWITYPHTCDPQEPANHSCTPEPDSTVYYYKHTFDLPDSVCNVPITHSNAYCLGIKMWADNCIRRVWQNGNVVYTSNSSPPASYGASDHTGPGKIVQMCSNWVKTGNEIIVEVHSEATSDITHGGWTGFLVQGDAQYSTDPSNPCDSVDRYDDDGGDPPSSDCCLGNKCGQHRNSLGADYEIPLNGHDFLFSDDTEAADQVGVGYSCRDLMPAKLNAKTQHRTNAGTSAAESIAIHGISTYNGMNETSVGVYGDARNMELQSKSVGVWGDAMGAHHNIGGRFYAEGGTDYNIGVSAIAKPSTGNAPAHSYLPGSNIGIYAAGDLPGIAGSNDWAGYFDGDVIINGTGYDVSMTPFTSDRKFKREIAAIPDATSIISKLQPMSYYMKTDNEFGLNFSDKKQYGFISQDVEKVLPELVHDVRKPAMIDSKGTEVVKSVEFKALNYIGFIALLTQGMKEQQQQIAQQQAEINELKALVRQSMGVQRPMDSHPGEAVPLSDKNTIVINQNVPNPFAESTVITYNIPAEFQKAQLIFRTSDGAVIKTTDITRAGKGSLTIFADDLSNGSYSYSLVVDGNVVDSKTMIKQ